jgi:hypothetical protein
MKTTRVAFLSLSLASVVGIAARGQQAPPATGAASNTDATHKTVRIAATQPKSRLIDWHVR